VWAKANGEAAELFSIREGAEGDLQVIIKRSEWFDPSFEDDERIPMENSYLSVHRSQQSEIGGRTVTFTVALPDGEAVRIVSFVHCEERPFLWPIFSRSYAKPSAPIFRMSARSKDTTVRVGSLDVNDETLITHVDAADAGTFDPPSDGRIWHTIPFEYFDLFVVACYLDLPSMNKGVTLKPLTSPGEGAEQEVWHAMTAAELELNLHVRNKLIIDWALAQIGHHIKIEQINIDAATEEAMVRQLHTVRWYPLASE